MQQTENSNFSIKFPDSQQEVKSILKNAQDISILNPEKKDSKLSVGFELDEEDLHNKNHKINKLNQKKQTHFSQKSHHQNPLQIVQDNIINNPKQQLQELKSLDHQVSALKEFSTTKPLSSKDNIVFNKVISSSSRKSRSLSQLNQQINNNSFNGVNGNEMEDGNNESVSFNFGPRHISYTQDQIVLQNLMCKQDSDTLNSSEEVGQSGIIFANNNNNNNQSKSNIQSQQHIPEVEQQTALNQLNSLFHRKPQQNLMTILKASNLLLNIKKFKQNARQSFQDSMQLTDTIMEHINDLCNYQNPQQHKKTKGKNSPSQSLQKLQLKRKLNQLRNYIGKLPVFTPFNKYLVIFNIVLWIGYLGYMFLMCLIIFFQLGNYLGSNIAYALFALFLLEILVQINTGILKQGVVLLDRFTIINHYIKRYFTWDILALLPILINLFFNIQSQSNLQLTLLSVLGLAKVINYYSLIKRILTYSNLYGVQRHLFLILKLIFNLFVFIHIFGCILHGFSILETHYLGYEDTNWTKSSALQNEDGDTVMKRYVYSIYFIAVVMNTVGFGDITPQNSLEYFVIILVMVISGIFYGYNLNEIGRIMNDMRASEKQCNEDLNALKQYVTEENINSQLSIRLQNYIRYIHKHDNEELRAQQNTAIQKLSDNLQNELKEDVFQKHLKQINMLKQFCCSEALYQLIPFMQECRFSREDIIFKQNDEGDSSLYYIVEGEIEIFYGKMSQKKKKHIVNKKKNQEIFGEYSFYTNQPRDYSVRALNFCKLIKIPRIDFIKIIQKFEKDYHLFCVIRDNLLFKCEDRQQNDQLNARMSASSSAISIENDHLFSPLIKKKFFNFDQTQVQLKCFTCKQPNHLTFECPRSHLNINKQLMIEKYNYIEKSRTNFLRYNKKFQTLTNILEIQEHVIDILECDELESVIDAIAINIEEFSDDEDFFSDSYIYDNYQTESSFTQDLSRSKQTENTQIKEESQSDYITESLTSGISSNAYNFQAMNNSSSNPTTTNNALTNYQKDNNHLKFSYKNYESKNSYKSLKSFNTKQLSFRSQKSGRSYKSQRSSLSTKQAKQYKENYEKTKSYYQKLNVQEQLKDNYNRLKTRQQSKRQSMIYMKNQLTDLEKLTHSNKKQQQQQQQQNQQIQPHEKSFNQQFSTKSYSKSISNQYKPPSSQSNNDFQLQNILPQNYQFSQTRDNIKENTLKTITLQVNPTTQQISFVQNTTMNTMGENQLKEFEKQFSNTGKAPQLIKGLQFYILHNQDDENAVGYYIGNIGMDKMKEFQFYKNYDNLGKVLNILKEKYKLNRRQSYKSKRKGSQHTNKRLDKSQTIKSLRSPLARLSRNDFELNMSVISRQKKQSVKSVKSSQNRNKSQKKQSFNNNINMDDSKSFTVSNDIQNIMDFSYNSQKTHRKKQQQLTHSSYKASKDNRHYNNNPYNNSSSRSNYNNHDHNYVNQINNNYSSSSAGLGPIIMKGRSVSDHSI